MGSDNSRNVLQTTGSLVGYRGVPVSAAQIRIGGAKGVIAVVEDETLHDMEIRLRPSMIKLRGRIPMHILNVIKVCTMLRTCDALC